MATGPQDLTAAERSLVGAALVDAYCTTRRARAALATAFGESHPEVRSADVDLQTLVTGLRKIAPRLVPVGA